MRGQAAMRKEFEPSKKSVYLGNAFDDVRSRLMMQRIGPMFAGPGRIRKELQCETH